MAAIRTLLKVLKHSKCKYYNKVFKNIIFVQSYLSCASLAFVAETVQELRICLQHAIDAMRSTETPVTAIASGSELFLRFITLATLDTPVRMLKFKLMIYRKTKTSNKT